MSDSSAKLTTNPLVYAGCYSPRGESGKDTIFVYHLNMETGELVLDSSVYGGENASYLAISPDNHLMIAVNELMTFEGQTGGGVAALAIDPLAGRLTLLNQQKTHGGLPCYASIDASQRVAIVSNYVGGNVALFPIHEDGTLGQAADIVQHTGSSVHPDRQKTPYAHSVIIDPTNRFAIVSDLGIDKVMVYKIDFENLKLVFHSHVVVQSGAGPRHFAFHPNGRWAYVIHELDSYITAFSFDADAGSLSIIQTVPTMPSDFEGSNTSADIHVSPSGRFVYGSNRGHDSIAVFSVDDTNGQLTFVERHSSGGQVPRNFVIDSTGEFLLAANQETGNIVSFRLDQHTGKMTETGHSVTVFKPVCLKFWN